MVLCGGVGNVYLGDRCSSLPVGSYGIGGTHKFSKIQRSPYVQFYNVFWHAMTPFIRMTLCQKCLLYDAGGLCSLIIQHDGISFQVFSISGLGLLSMAGPSAPFFICVIACNLLMVLFLQ